ncbi:erythromycin esterase family protein [Rhodococcus olei]|uniref:Erythromycin esterase family protein n=1 Tax=Rhodococcus olei TaxID=2161675 RepID=A0ABP8PMQ7_9NOCA
MSDVTKIPAQRPGRVFQDRREAGRALAELLAAYRDNDRVVVLGLARGGVPVAWEIAAALDAPLDTFVVRKLGVPGHEEFAMGALASGGSLVVNDDTLRDLDITPDQLREVVEREAHELDRREKTYRGDTPPSDVAGKIVIVADDGLATGAGMFAALDALRRQEPAQIIVAVPAAPESTCRQLGAMVDDVICATMPFPFTAVGASFWDFGQVTDDEVRALLHTPTVGRTTRDVGVREFRTAADTLRRACRDAPGGVPYREDLLDLVGDARIVLIGESSHGTQEFYAARAEITRTLIEEKGFTAVAVEADWPDAFRINRYVHGQGVDTSAEESLRGFARFPAWMWRNTIMLDFVSWLRQHNEHVSGDQPEVEFYGLDLYSLHRSMHEVVSYLDRVDPDAARRARQRYACFDQISRDDGHTYGYVAAFGAGESRERQVVEQLLDLQRHAITYVRSNGADAEDAQFYAERNAHSVRDAEQYYRAMFRGQVASWNLRDHHMTDTLDALITHLDRRGEAPSRVVVWAHNSHVGDATATEAGAHGQVTVGHLVRERHRDDSCLIGFTTHHGTVTAASEWGGIAERKVVRPALPGSIEALLHEVGKESFLIRTTEQDVVADTLRTARIERAIGVIYLPTTERQSHYFHARVAEQFDAVIHVDTTSALEPLECTSVWIEGERPETYPTAL